MDVAKAKHLLELLRRRTVERGATAGEAAQAAALAEKLINRFGLDGDSAKYSETVQMKQNRFPEWAETLASAIQRRFGCDAIVTEKRGTRCTVRFVGQEHTVGVARWLFLAVLGDLMQAAQREGRKAGMKGPRLVKFRNRFLYAAAWSVFCRLNEKHIERMRLEWQSQREKEQSERPEPRCNAKPKTLTRKQLQDELFDTNAALAGYRTGDQVSLSADVIGTEQEPLRLAAPCATGGEV